MLAECYRGAAVPGRNPQLNHVYYNNQPTRSASWFCLVALVLVQRKDEHLKDKSNHGSLIGGKKATMAVREQREIPVQK